MEFTASGLFLNGIVYPLLFIIVIVSLFFLWLGRESKESREAKRIKKEEDRPKKLDVWIGMIIVLVIPVWFIIWGINKLIVNYTDWDLHLFFFTTYMEPVLGG